MSSALRRDIELSGPLDLCRSIGRLGLWSAGCSLRLERSPDLHRVWWTTRSPQGPASACVQNRPGRAEARVRVDAWGPGAHWLLERAPRWLGAQDDPAAFRPGAAPLRRLALAHPGLRFGATEQLIERLLPVVAAQQVTGAGAKRAWRRLQRRYGRAAPGPAPLPLPPDPAEIAQLSPSHLIACGIDARRARAMIAACRRRSRIDALADRPAAEAQAKLQQLPGIGPWTAALTITVSHGDADAVPTGDAKLPQLISTALAGEPRGKDARMLELLEPYRPHRMRAILLIKSTGMRAPRYGPRTDIRDIRRN